MGSSGIALECISSSDQLQTSPLDGRPGQGHLNRIKNWLTPPTLLLDQAGQATNLLTPRDFAFACLSSVVVEGRDAEKSQESKVLPHCA